MIKPVTNKIIQGGGDLRDLYDQLEKVETQIRELVKQRSNINMKIKRIKWAEYDKQQGKLFSNL